MQAVAGRPAARAAPRATGASRRSPGRTATRSTPRGAARGRSWRGRGERRVRLRPDLRARSAGSETMAELTDAQKDRISHRGPGVPGPAANSSRYPTQGRTVDGRRSLREQAGRDRRRPAGAAGHPRVLRGTFDLAGGGRGPRPSSPWWGCSTTSPAEPLALAAVPDAHRPRDLEPGAALGRLRGRRGDAGGPRRRSAVGPQERARSRPATTGTPWCASPCSWRSRCCWTPCGTSSTTSGAAWSGRPSARATCVS